MDENDLKAALKKIHKSLNKKFSKNPVVFFSRMEEKRLKKHIYNGDFSGIYAMFKEKVYSPEIITAIILNNLWLFPLDADENDINKLHCIFKVCSPRDLFNEKIKDVLSKNFDIPSYLKKDFLDSYYGIFEMGELYKMLDSDKCSQLEKRYCFEYILKKSTTYDEYFNNVGTLVEKFNFLKFYNGPFENLSERDNNFRDSLAKVIIKTKYSTGDTELKKPWDLIILKLEKNAFDIIVEFVENSSLMNPFLSAIFGYAFKIVENSSFLISNDNVNFQYYIDRLINFIITGKDRQDYFNKCLNGIDSMDVKFKIIAGISGMAQESFDEIINLSILKDVSGLNNSIENERGIKIVDRLISALRKNSNKRELFRNLLQRKGHDKSIHDLIVKIITRIPDLIIVIIEHLKEHKIPLLNEKITILINNRPDLFESEISY